MDALEPKTIRYAVVGLGHIAQVAVLPAFKHAEHTSLTALVSGDAIKRKKLGRKYKVPHVYSYDEFGECLASDEVDAVYIALPNSMHCKYAVKAAEAGKHILCEKPMAVTEDECRRMLAAVEAHGVKLMIAYRLHFEEANLKALEMVQQGEIGEPRFFTSDFSMQVKDGNIRLDRNWAEARCTTSAFIASTRLALCSGPNRSKFSRTLPTGPMAGSAKSMR